MQSWTKDAAGEHVRWNEPPHYIDGVVNLLLPGETCLSPPELSKRRREFMKLQRRDLKRKK